MGMMYFEIVYSKNAHHLWSMNEGLKPNEYKGWAKLLYTKHEKTVKDVALETGVEESIVEKWVKEGNWVVMKRAVLTSKKLHLDLFYDQMEKLRNKILAGDENNAKDMELMGKYTMAIKNLEAETSITTIIEVSELFITWLRRRDQAEAKKLVVLFDEFVKYRQNSSLEAA